MMTIIVELILYLVISTILCIHTTGICLPRNDSYLGLIAETELDKPCHLAILHLVTLDLHSQMSVFIRTWKEN